MKTVHGQVNKIIYHNDNNGYTILKLKLDYKNNEMSELRSVLFSNILTILCTLDRKPLVDEEIEFTGELESSQYGYQLKATSYKRVSVETKEGVITYLTSDFFPGIGQKTAEKVFLSLGEQALKSILEDRQVLDKIDITEKQKDVIYNNLIIHYKNESQLLNLLNLGLTMNLAVKLIKSLGDLAYEIIKDNPYQLIDLVEGIAFIRADEIAQLLKIEKNAPIRLQALVLYILKKTTYSSGNSYISYNDLYSSSIAIANADDEVLNKDNFNQALAFLLENKKIIKDEDDNYFEYHIYQDEIKVARKIAEFLQSEVNDYETDKIPLVLERVMLSNNIEYSEKQKEAIIKALKEPIVIITGGPGTGKSTIIKGIIDCYSQMFQKDDIIREQILLVAPTGRASKRLREVTAHYASTIHKLLGYEGNGRFAVTEKNPLNAKMIIIDEFSMVDISLAAILFSCLLPTIKIVIVGDVDQLPAVGIGNVLGDLIASKEVTTIRLDKIHRQADDSTIIHLAHDVNQGFLPENILQKQHDRNFLLIKDEAIIENVEKVIKQGIESGMNIIRDIQVLVPLYRGQVGIDALNQHLQKTLNEQNIEINYSGRKFRLNDKVIQLVNRSEKQVMNGDIGQIISIEKNNDAFASLDVMFDFGMVHYEKEEIEDLSLAYAISIHKSQGSEFALVIVPFSFKYYVMLKRKLIYTAITRAKKFLIMLGNIEAMYKGIQELEQGRQTKLQDRLKVLIANPNRIFDINSAFKEISSDFATIADFMEKEDDEELEKITPYDFLDKS